MTAITLQAPAQAQALPEQSIEQAGSMIKIKEKIENGDKVIGLDELVRDGSIISYSREGDDLVAFANSAEAAEKLKHLRTEAQGMSESGILDKVKQLFIPPNMDENCSEEYGRFRMWQILGTVCGGGIGFMNNRVYLDAVKFLNNSEKVALAGAMNGMMGKFTSMGASYLAQKGDIDPKKYVLASSLIASTNALITLAVISTLPAAYIPVSTALAITGALAGTLGGAAGVNIFNHMAKGSQKGLVSSKNANQDMMADMMGMPVAYGLSRLAGALGVNPFLFTAGVLGPLLVFCTLKMATSIKMEPLTQGKLEKIMDQYLKTGQVPEAEQKSLVENVKNLFVTEQEEVSKRVNFAGSIEEVVGKDKDAAGADKLFGLFNDEKYLVSYHGSTDKINIAFKKKAAFNDAMKAIAQARLIEMSLDSGMLPVLQQLCGDKAGLALVDLTRRALPDELNMADKLKEKGWHANEGKLDIEKLEISGASQLEPGAPIALNQYLKLIASPSPEALKKYLRPEVLGTRAQAGELPKAA